MKTKIILTIIALVFCTLINAQTNSVPKECLGLYEASYENDGNTVEFNYAIFIDSVSNELNVYKQIESVQYINATYYKVKSFNQQNGEMIINSKLTISFDHESKETTILKDTTEKNKLIFVLNKSNKYYFIDSESGPAPDGIVNLSNNISSEIFNEKGIQYKLLLNPNYLNATKSNALGIKNTPVDTFSYEVKYDSGKLRYKGKQIKDPTRANEKIMVGEYTEYYENGNVKKRYMCKQGMPIEYMSYFENGNIEITCPPNDDEGNWHGYKTEYYSNGNVKEKYFYYHNKQKFDGLNETFHPNGKPKFKEGFKNGQHVGERIAWDSLGNKLDYSNYNDQGQLVGLYIYYYAGTNKLKSKGNYKIVPLQVGDKKMRSVKDGEWIEYHYNGQIQSKAIYKDGEKNGTCTSYYTDGKIGSKRTFIMGEESGISESYDENGLISKKETYVRKKFGDSWIGVKDGKSLEYKNGKLYREAVFKDGKVVSIK